MGTSDISKLEQWKKEHPQKVRAAIKAWRQKHKDKVAIWNNREREKLRLDVLKHYSGTNPPQCANPYGEHEKPYTNLDALSIDHINGGGRQEGIRLGRRGDRFYRWLRANRYPSGYQVLCMNCQWIKRRRNHEANQYSKPFKP